MNANTLKVYTWKQTKRISADGVEAYTCGYCGQGEHILYEKGKTHPIYICPYCGKRNEYPSEFEC